MIKPSRRTFFFAIFFVVLITLPVALNQYYNYLLSPVSKSAEPDPVIFVITPGEAIVSIAQNLKEKNLIKDAFAFRLLIAQMAIGKSIQAGDFRLYPNMSAKEIAQELTHGAIDVWITLPEGLRIEEQAQKIEQKLTFGQNSNYNFDKKEFIKLAKEGYMFPDTYLIPKDANAKLITNRLLQTFEEKVRESILANAKSNLSTEDIIILASLIEKEAKTAEEKPIIAGIITNRLNIGMALQVDATVAYAKGYDSAKNTWWPQITREDYRTVRSPYNTYLNVGLPPAPIASPGIDSIRAALNPADTEYFYYLHDADGKVHFAVTGQEHNQNIADFL